MGIIDKLIELETNKPAEKPVAKPVAEKKEYVRTLGDVRVAAEAQRSFNPALPPVKPKGPTAAQVDLGMSAQMHADADLGWGGTDA